MRPKGIVLMEVVEIGCWRCSGHRPLEIRGIGIVCAVCFGDAYNTALQLARSHEIWDRAVTIYRSYGLMIEHPDTIAA